MVVTETGKTPSEQFVFELSKNSFLSLWCYVNPIGKKNKELCDILVVFDPHVLIISVKERSLELNDNPKAEHQRWQRKAVDASVKQLYGAERWLESASHVIANDGAKGLQLPALDRRKIHRIAVACGAKQEAILPSKDFGKGFVHVVDEVSFQDITSELDTIQDFVAYFEAKEELFCRSRLVAIEGSEANLLGLYLQNNRTFPFQADTLMVDDTVWQGIQTRPEWIRRKQDDEISYVWDKLIEFLSAPNGGEDLADVRQAELAYRTMASESRFARRALGESLASFLKKRGELRSRVVHSVGDTTYVLVWFGSNESKEARLAELGCRCLIVRHLLGKGNIVVGIGIGEFKEGVGSWSDLIYLDFSDWSDSDSAEAEQMQAMTGYFKGADYSCQRISEYPTPD